MHHLNGSLAPDVAFPDQVTRAQGSETTKLFDVWFTIVSRAAREGAVLSPVISILLLTAGFATVQLRIYCFGLCMCHHMPSHGELHNVRPARSACCGVHIQVEIYSIQ